MTTNAPRRSIVVSGASTGIGAAIAADLAGSGFRVFAGVRREEDARRLADQGPGIVPLRLDVTSPDSIGAAVRIVEQAQADAGALPMLSGLVNNAGIVLAGPLEFLPLDEVRHQFEVNVFGPIALTQAFLPMLRAAKGRIVNIGSLSGRVCAPFLGPYGASKFALEALTDALRVELHRWDVRVSIIEPGSVATPIWGKTRAQSRSLQDRLPALMGEFYGDALDTLRAISEENERNGVAPEAIARAVRHALVSPRPRTRYPVGLDARFLMPILRGMPDRLRDWCIRKRLGLRPPDPRQSPASRSLSAG